MRYPWSTPRSKNDGKSSRRRRTSRTKRSDRRRRGNRNIESDSHSSQDSESVDSRDSDSYYNRSSRSQKQRRGKKDLDKDYYYKPSSHYHRPSNQGRNYSNRGYDCYYQEDASFGSKRDTKSTNSSKLRPEQYRDYGEDVMQRESANSNRRSNNTYRSDSSWRPKEGPEENKSASSSNTKITTQDTDDTESKEKGAVVQFEDVITKADDSQRIRERLGQWMNDGSVKGMAVKRTTSETTVRTEVRVIGREDFLKMLHEVKASLADSMEKLESLESLFLASNGDGQEHKMLENNLDNSADYDEIHSNDSSEVQDKGMLPIKEASEMTAPRKSKGAAATKKKSPTPPIPTTIHSSPKRKKNNKKVKRQSKKGTNGGGPPLMETIHTKNNNASGKEKGDSITTSTGQLTP